MKYSAIVDKHIKPAIGGYLVQAIDSLTIEQFGHDLLTEKALAPKTVRDILSLLKTVLQYAHKTVSGIDLVEVTYPKLPKQEMRILSREEQDIFVQYLLNDPDPCKFGVLFSLLTGLRIGEICALKWRNISLPDGTVSVSSTMQRLKNSDGGSSSKTSIRISTPKSERDLSKALKLQNAGLYYYFQSKDDAVIACAEEASFLLEDGLIVPALSDIYDPEILVKNLFTRADSLALMMRFLAQVCSANELNPSSKLGNTSYQGISKRNLSVWQSRTERAPGKRKCKYN